MPDKPGSQRWRQSAIALGKSAQSVFAQVRRHSAKAFAATGRRTGAALARALDGGYRGEAVVAVAHDPTGAEIEVADLSVAYGGALALEGLNGRFEAGSLTAVAGPNGAGKSSLLRALAGLQRPRTGRIVCPALAKGQLAYLPQQAAIDRNFPITVDAFVTLGGWRTYGAFRPPPQTMIQRASEAVAMVGLEDLRRRPIGALSVGEFQRALFARLLLQDAAVVLLDEPFAAIDEQTTQDLLAIVQRLHAQQRTVIAVLHDFAQVRAHFPQTLLLARRCVGWGDTAQVLSDDNLALARNALRLPTGRPAQAAA